MLDHVIREVVIDEIILSTIVESITEHMQTLWFTCNQM